MHVVIQIKARKILSAARRQTLLLSRFFTLESHDDCKNYEDRQSCVMKNFQSIIHKVLTRRFDKHKLQLTIRGIGCITTSKMDYLRFNKITLIL